MPFVLDVFLALVLLLVAGFLLLACLAEPVEASSTSGLARIPLVDLIERRIVLGGLVYMSIGGGSTPSVNSLSNSSII